MTRKRKPNLADRTMSIVLAFLSAIWFVAIGVTPVALHGYFLAGGRFEGAFIGSIVGAITFTTREFYDHLMAAQDFENWPNPDRARLIMLGYVFAILTGVAATTVIVLFARRSFA